MLQVKVKLLHPDAKLPTKSGRYEAGWDLYSSEDVPIDWGESKRVSTGISLEIPPGWYGQVQDRSSMVVKGLFTMGGVIDCTYRGELMVILNNNHYPGFFHIKAGDRIAQLILHPVPAAEMLLVDELTSSDRGSNGFGSTGA